MSRSSPAWNRPLHSSPDRGLLSNFLHENRNNEEMHHDALAAAQLEHSRVREAALRVFELHEMKERHERILEQERREQARLKVETELAAEQRRLQELMAKSIPKPPPPPQPSSAPQTNTTSTKPVQQHIPRQEQEATTTQPQPSGHVPNQHEAQTNTQPLFKPSEPSKSLSQTAAASNTTQFPRTQPQTAPVPPQSKLAKSPTFERYLQIHKELKELRKDLVEHSKQSGSPLKGNLGTLRRSIRVTIGQLTSDLKVNMEKIKKVTEALLSTLQGQIPSPSIEVNRFVVDAREPTNASQQDGPTLPSLFIYLLNIFAKAVINQFINECGPNPKAAEPIGVATAKIFSSPQFQWRGSSLIDILFAKYHVVCPVLFGMRGNDKIERGRLALGWKKDGTSWITEQSHNDRMAGLGAGFASIALRDFKKSPNRNPYPPTHYWKALAFIINTPKGETSNTQYIVVRSMIDGHERRFINFYGNAAIAALQFALVEFPRRAPEASSAAGSLIALADVFRSEIGLALS